jgi:hypothetical protein
MKQIPDSHHENATRIMSQKRKLQQLSMLPIVFAGDDGGVWRCFELKNASGYEPIDEASEWEIVQKWLLPAVEKKIRA